MMAFEPPAAPYSLRFWKDLSGVESLQEKNQALEEENQALNKEWESLAEELRLLRASRRHSEQEKHKLLQSTLQAHSSCEALASSLQSLQAQNDKLSRMWKKQAKSFARRMREAEGSRQKLSQENSRLKAQLVQESAQAEIAQERRQLQEMNSIVLRRVKEMQKEMQAIRVERDEALVDSSYHKWLLELAKHDLQRSEEQATAHRLENETLRFERDRAVQCLDADTEAQLAASTATLELQHAESRLHRVTGERDALKVERDDLALRVAELEHALHEQMQTRDLALKRVEAAESERDYFWWMIHEEEEKQWEERG